MKHNQLILNTGASYSGIIYAPFSTEVPSEYAAPKHAPISSSGSGWIARPDAGKTSLSKDLSAPIGEPYILALFALLYVGFKKFMACVILLFLSPLFIQAQVASLTIGQTVCGEEATINPVISSVPFANASICWGLYYDNACSNEVEGVGFYGAPATGVNAVGMVAPTNAGLYYLKTTLRAAYVCGGSVDSEVVTPIMVYPADADIVLLRNAQEAAERVDITEDASKQAYGVLRFRKEVLNNESVSEFARYNYFISFPFDVKIGDISGIGTVGTDWRILYYDGKGRAEEGFFAERTDNWVMFEDTEDILHAEEGYLLQLNTYSMQEENEDVWVNGMDVACLFFPALSNINKIETGDVAIPALGSDYACTIDLSAGLGSEGDRRVKDSYWRCIGVPSFNSLSTVEGLEYFYSWDPSDNSLNVQSSEGFEFQPTHAYLVQNENAFTWKNAMRPSNSIARQRGTVDQEWILEIKQENTMQDRTFVRMTNKMGISDGFDFGYDLSKEWNAGKANVYTLAGYERLAANILPDTTQVVPVGLRIAQDGEYRLVTNENAWLVDSETAVRTQDYTIYLEAGKYEGRFQLETGEAIFTGLERDEIDSDKIRKVLVNGILYIEKGGKKYIIH